MNSMKEYLLKNFEQAFVLLVLLSVVGIYYLAPFKLAFLNFFFIPILMAGYYLGLRYAVLGAFLCIVMVCTYAAYDSTPFMYVPEKEHIYLQLSLWGGFLILSGALVGKLYENLDIRIKASEVLNLAYQQSQTELETANTELKHYTENLESMVEEKTRNLSESKQIVEQLKARVEEVLHTSMDPVVAQMLIEKRLRNEKKHIAVLVSDLHHFTPYVEGKQPESVIQELNRYLKDMSGFMDSYSAHLDKYTGDGYMLEFGMPIDYKYHSLQAVVCGIRMMEFMRSSAYPWKMRLGITSGDAVVGMIGGRRKTYTVMGNCANTASRLESLCTPGSLLIDEETYKRTSTFIEAKVFHIDDVNRKDRDNDIESVIHSLMQQSTRKPEDIDLLVLLGNKLMQYGDSDQAKSYFLKAMRLHPELKEAKIGFAEASMQTKNDLIQLKGRTSGFILYEVIGLRDFLVSSAIPEEIRHKFGRIIQQSNIQSELVWPAEIISGQLGHAARTTLLAYALADRMNIGASDRQALVTAGFLHNCGHQIVSHSVLTKATALTREDILAIQRHPEESVRIMLRHGYDDRATLECVLHHHQTPTNNGYPSRKSNKPISKIARILSIAEVYEALTENRPWRDRWNPESALEEMHIDVANGRFDGEIFEAFEKMIISGLNPTS